MRSGIKLFLLYLLVFLLATVGYIASFHTPLLANVDVFFYRGLFLIAIWGVVAGVVMHFLAKKYKGVLLGRDALFMFIIFCCVNVVIFTHLPVTADRSISVFMLGYMNENEVTKEEMEKVFIDTYVYEYSAFDKRFHEQIETGTIEEHDGKYVITEAGKGIVRIYELVCDLFGVDDKLVRP